VKQLVRLVCWIFDPVKAPFAEEQEVVVLVEQIHAGFPGVVIRMLGEGVVLVLRMLWEVLLHMGRSALDCQVQDDLLRCAAWTGKHARIQVVHEVVAGTGELPAPLPTLPPGDPREFTEEVTAVVTLDRVVTECLDVVVDHVGLETQLRVQSLTSRAFAEGSVQGMSGAAGRFPVCATQDRLEVCGAVVVGDEGEHPVFGPGVLAVELAGKGKRRPAIGHGSTSQRILRLIERRSVGLRWWVRYGHAPGRTRGEKPLVPLVRSATRAGQDPCCPSHADAAGLP
jgi:hypothetical protein